MSTRIHDRMESLTPATCRLYCDMAMEHIRPSGLFTGVPYAYATSVRPGNLIFTAGACPLDEDGAVVALGDLEGQTVRALANLFTTLAAAGSSPAGVLKTTVYVVATERADLVRAWTIVKDGFGAIDPPSTLLGVAMLGYPDQMVEIEAIAVAASR